MIVHLVRVEKVKIDIDNLLQEVDVLGWSGSLFSHSLSPAHKYHAVEQPVDHLPNPDLIRLHYVKRLPDRLPFVSYFQFEHKEGKVGNKANLIKNLFCR